MNGKHVFLTSMAIFGCLIVGTAVVSGEYFILGWLLPPVFGLALVIAQDIVLILFRVRRREHRELATLPEHIQEAEEFPTQPHKRIRYL